MSDVHFLYFARFSMTFQRGIWGAVVFEGTYTASTANELEDLWRACTLVVAEVIKNEMVKPYQRLQSQGYVKMAYRCSKLNAYFLLSCREHATLICFCLCRPTVTLHQGQGPRSEHELIWHPSV